MRSGRKIIRQRPDTITKPSRRELRRHDAAAARAAKAALHVGLPRRSTKQRHFCWYGTSGVAAASRVTPTCAAQRLPSRFAAVTRRVVVCAAHSVQRGGLLGRRLIEYIGRVVWYVQCRPQSGVAEKRAAAAVVAQGVARRSVREVQAENSAPAQTASVQAKRRRSDTCAGKGAVGNKM